MIQVFSDYIMWLEVSEVLFHFWQICYIGIKPHLLFTQFIYSTNIYPAPSTPRHSARYRLECLEQTHHHGADHGQCGQTVERCVRMYAPVCCEKCWGKGTVWPAGREEALGQGSEPLRTGKSPGRSLPGRLRDLGLAGGFGFL